MEKGITDRLKELEDRLRDKEERQMPKPKFKLPLKVSFGKGRVIKRDWCIVHFIRTNGAVETNIYKIEEDTVRINENFYDARSGNVLRYKGMPLLIIKEWNDTPETSQARVLDLKKDYDDASLKGTLTTGQKLIMTKMKMEAIKPKMNLNLGTILIIAAVLGGGYFLLNSMGVL